jgi:Zn-dependent protease
MLPRALRLLTVRGIDVRVDPWLAPLMVLLAWTFGRRIAPTAGPAVTVLVGAAVTIGLFASVLVHELGHALEARHRGMAVHGITLLPLGGATAIDERGQSARDEFAVAAIGPWLSLTLAAALGLTATALAQVPGLPGLTVPIGAIAGFLGWMNLSLAVFNLLPGAPLDGGRVLRALVWRLTGDRGRGVRVSARIGQALGIAVVAAGAWWLTTDPAALIGGGWTIIVGAFLVNGARADRRHHSLRALLDGTRIDALWERRPAPVDADATLDRLVPEPLPPGTAHLPVVRGGRVVGALDLEEFARTHPSDRAVRRAADLAVPLDGLPTVDRSADLHVLMDAFTDGRTLAVLTTDGPDGRVAVDVVDRRAVLAALGALERAPGRRPRATRGSDRVRA